MDLKANPDRSADGVVIEAKLDRGRGAVATVLVKRGTLKRGDIVVAGASWGRVRALLNERDEQVAEAGPSTPVEVLGLDGAPDPGEPFAVVERRGPRPRAHRLPHPREARADRRARPAPARSLADMMAKLRRQEGLASCRCSSRPTCRARPRRSSARSTRSAPTRSARGSSSPAPAQINESDVMLAKGVGAPILGFNVRASKQARDLAEREGVEIRYYAIIYDLLDDIKGVLSGMLAPIQRETFLGNAEVLQVFDISKVGKVAGCRVTEGVVRKGARVRIVREDVVVLELGTLQTLKRFKDEVNEVTVRPGMRHGLRRASRTSRPATSSSASPRRGQAEPVALPSRSSQRTPGPRARSPAAEVTPAGAAKPAGSRTLQLSPCSGPDLRRDERVVGDFGTMR